MWWGVDRGVALRAGADFGIGLRLLELFLACPKTTYHASLVVFGNAPGEKSVTKGGSWGWGGDPTRVARGVALRARAY